MKTVRRATIDKLDRTAHQLGFPNGYELMREWYTMQKISVLKISELLCIGEQTTRRILEHYRFPIRKRGGPNNVKIVITPELVQEVMRDGVRAVAERAGIGVGALYMRLKELRDKIGDKP